MTTFSAPAKIILYGEHAVVYGQPALAAPVESLRAFAEVHPQRSGSGLRLLAVDTGHDLPVDLAAEVDDALVEMAQRTLRFLGAAPPSAVVEVYSKIPLASGLGSGAAVSAALGRALAWACGVELAPIDLNALVYEVERRHHGTPSGIDNTVIVYDQPILFRSREDFTPLALGAPLTILIGDTGIRAPTRESVGDVRRLLERDRDMTLSTIEAIGAVVEQACVALSNGDLEMAGILMQKNHALLRQLTVSSPELDRLVDTALEAGALGAKLSGGGRGGNMIALVTPRMWETVADRLRGAGAVHVWKTTVA